MAKSGSGMEGEGFDAAAFCQTQKSQKAGFCLCSFRAGCAVSV